MHHCGTIHERHQWLRQVNEERKQNFALPDEGDKNKLLGIEMTRLDDKIFKIYQPFIIVRITYFLNIDRNDYGMDTNSKSTPDGKLLLSKDLSGKLCKESWNYRTEVFMLTYLQGNSCPEKTITVHQTARFSNSPMLSQKRPSCA